MLSLEILISCRNLGADIVARSGITSDALVINQCGYEDYEEHQRPEGAVRVFSVGETGLTKSRNLAIEKAEGDICLLCDDDEQFMPGYEARILKAYEALPQADIIVFQMANMPKKFGDKTRKLTFLDIMKVASWQISFRRERVIETGVCFDPQMGAGTGNGAEEEFKFLSDCRKAGLTVYYVPEVIAAVAQTESTWFHGFTSDFFVNRGNTTRYIMGLLPAVAYGLYYCLAKQALYKEHLGIWAAFCFICKGIAENRLAKKGEQDNV